MDQPTQVAVVDAVPVEYRLVHGTRGVVVVLHGGHTRAGLPLGEAALVAAGYTVLSPSRPGYGRTPLPAGPDAVRFASRTAALCSRLGLEDVLAVVGISAGGPTAVALAAQEPERVRGLVLHSARSSLAFPDGAARVVAPWVFDRRLERWSWSCVSQLVRRAPTAGLRLMMSSLSTLPARQVVDDLSPRERQVLTSTFAGMRSGAGFTVDVRSPVDPALEHEVSQRTLVVASRADGQVRWDHAEQLGRAIPRSTTWCSPSLSHLVWFGSGGPATARRTEDFLATL